MALLAQNDIATLPPDDWRQAAFADLATRLTPPSNFPCTFSQNAFRRGLIRFSFVDAPGEEGYADAMADLADYVAESADWDGQTNTARPLLMIFSSSAAAFDRADDYHTFGWQALQYWHDHDAAPWPENVSRDPKTPFWSFVFAGTQLFVNMSTPAHIRRRSRNLGRHFTLVINPRERFDIVAGDTPEGRRVRAAIRSRVGKYDDLPHSPLLGSYQKGELEWVQYALSDDGLDPPATCPFRFRGQG